MLAKVERGIEEKMKMAKEDEKVTRPPSKNKQ